MKKDLKHILFYTFISLLVKVSIYLILIYPTLATNNHVGPFLISGDHGEYITPVDNLITRGIYSLGSSNTPYAGRLPGFIFPYVLFRFFFNSYISNILLGISILLFSAISSYYLAQISYKISNNNKVAFLLTFILINCIPYFWYWDWTLHPNSLAYSCLIVGLNNLLLFTKNKQAKRIVWAGVFFCWLFMLRGFTFVFIPLVLLYIIEQLKKDSFKNIFKFITLFLLPLILSETLWIARNFYSLKQFIPLQTSFVPLSDSKNPEYGTHSTTKYSIMKVRELINCWGGDNFWYFNNSDLAWFLNRGNYQLNNVFDKEIFFDGFTPDSLIALKIDIINSYKNDLTESESVFAEKKIIDRSTRYKKLFLEKKKYYFYFIAPINRLSNFLFRNPVQDWPCIGFEKMNILQKILKIASLAEYIILLTIVPIALILIKRFIKRFEFLLLLSIPISLIVEFSLLINSAHYSYFQTGYIALILIFVFILFNYPINLFHLKRFK